MAKFKEYKLGDIADILTSNVDKKVTPNQKTVKLCNFVDVYHNWAITKENYASFMTATASDEEISKFSLKKGQVAFTKDSETRDDIGIPTYIAESFNDVVLGYHTALATPDENIVTGEYLNAFMHSSFIQKYFELNATGSGMRYTLSLQTLHDIPILAPDLPTQNKIGALLSNIDHKISVNREINRNLEELAKQIYDYWFVQFDFPNEDGKPYKSSGGKMVWNELLKREIPAGWEVESVNNISTSCRGVGYTSKDEKSVTDKNIVLILRGNNIANNHIIYDDNTVFVDKSFVSEEQKIKKFDIIITMSSGSKEHVGKSAMFLFDSPHSYGAFCNKIIPKKNYQYFLENYLHSNFFIKCIRQFASGTGINNLTNEHFSKTFFAFPPTKILGLFNKKVEDIYKQKGFIEQECLQLSVLRNTLLPLLMNGQVTLNSCLSHE
ncbi:restriction endonuclease subunit S [Treponema sp. Marseille-Q4132]|uniref:restriction endonuclease subunit S n=1 Tax=Treponema sp. Marseille-Q4132 TaxID=2766701 RepID=UPI001C0779B5|nr:restriction endonuclease subunit S [Treponema sp. Marseille-Q4132]